MRTPVAALVWESWRLTRFEMGLRIAVAIIGGGAPLLVASAAASLGGMTAATRANVADVAGAASLFIMAFVALPFWLCIALLKGGRILDGGKPGFPFTIGYPRPVSTGCLVGVPMTYFAIAAAAAYVIPATVLGAIFGYAFPLAPIAAWLVALSFAQAATGWWTHSKTVQLAGNISAVAGCMWLIGRQTNGEVQPPAQWPTQFALSLGDYGVIGSIAVASLVLAIASVARQRHGDALIPVEGTGAAWLPRWHVELFRFPCPTSTPARAQSWVEIRNTGAPVLAAGVGLAVAIPALLAAVTGWTSAQLLALSPAILAPLLLLRLGIGNVFGLRQRPGRTDAGTFDVSQPIGTMPLVAIKVLVRAISFLLALVALGVSYWSSVPMLREWTTILPSNYEAMTGAQRAVAAALEALTVPQRAALAVIIFTGVSTTVAHVASLQVFRLLHAVRVYAGVLALLAYTLTFLVWSSGWLAHGFGVAVARTYPWVVATAISLSTVHVFRLALREQLLTAWHTLGAVLLWAVCLVSWLTLTQGRDVDIAARPPAAIALMLSLSLLPATAVALTPWAYSLVRHR